jgi:hypothetical protein
VRLYAPEHPDLADLLADMDGLMPRDAFAAVTTRFQRFLECRDARPAQQQGAGARQPEQPVLPQGGAQGEEQGPRSEQPELQQQQGGEQPELPQGGEQPELPQGDRCDRLAGRVVKAYAAHVLCRINTRRYMRCVDKIAQLHGSGQLDRGSMSAVMRYRGMSRDVDAALARGRACLNEHQEDVLRECLARPAGGGGLSLPMGYGKTLLSLVLALQHVHDLREQDREPDQHPDQHPVPARPPRMSWRGVTNRQAVVFKHGREVLDDHTLPLCPCGRALGQCILEQVQVLAQVSQETRDVGMDLLFSTQGVHGCQGWVGSAAVRCEKKLRDASAGRPSLSSVTPQVQRSCS